jgi:hypothetical protein
MIQLAAAHSDGGISLGEIAAVVGLCVAVTTALVVPVGAVLRRTRRDVKKLEEEVAETLRNEPRQRAAMADVAGRGFAGSLSSLEFSAGLLQRVMDDRVSEIDPAAAIRELQHLRVDIERAWLETRLISGSRAIQTSALQQLVNTRRDGGEPLLAGLSENSKDGAPSSTRTGEGQNFPDETNDSS